MTTYKYLTVLEAQNDGKPPNDNVEEGTRILKAGKHDEDSIEYMGEENGLHSIQFEAVETHEAPERMSDREIHNWFAEEVDEEQ